MEVFNLASWNLELNTFHLRGRLILGSWMRKEGSACHTGLTLCGPCVMKRGSKMDGAYSWRVPILDAYTAFEEHFYLCISGLMGWTPIDTLCSPGSTCAHCIKTGKLGSHSCALPRKRARVVYEGTDVSGWIHPSTSNSRAGSVK